MPFKNSPNYALLSYGIDLVVTTAALFLATYLRNILEIGIALKTEGDNPTAVVLLTLVVWSAVFFLMDAYNPRQSYRRAVEEFQNIIVSAFLALGVLAGLLYFSYRDMSRVLIIYFFVLDVVMLLGWRVGMRLYYRMRAANRFRTRRVLIVGASELGEKAYGLMTNYNWLGLNVVGVMDDNPSAEVEGLPVLGSIENTRAIVEQENIDEVIIALPHKAYEKLNKVVVDLQTLPVQIRVVPDYISLALYRATVEDFGGMLVVNLREPALTVYQRLIKRAFDLMVTSLIVAMAMPIMILVGIAIRMDSPGPIIFRQKRVGENGKLFTMYKFRSMVANADKIVRYDEDGNIVHKFKQDPRITPVGHFIRKTSLDELPQFFNVLKGDMSLVGPRPELPWLVQEYEPWQRKRFAVPQGITGWWQVTGRSDKALHLHTEDDLYYIQNYSIFLDLRILWKTLPAVLRRRGAY